MKIIENDRGRTVTAPLRWVDFVVLNPDIMATLSSQSPLRAKKVGDGKFHLTIFGVSVKVEHVHHELTEKQGVLKSVSDIRLPWGMGSTHTISKYSYAAIDEKTTALELNLSIELTTLRMRFYAMFYRNRLDRYMNMVSANIETAAKLLNEGKEPEPGVLDQEQQDRIAEIRRFLTRQSRSDIQYFRKFEGAMRIVMSDSSLLVAAEARMPDQRILSANGRCSLTPEYKQTLLSGLINLASINNQAMPTRGGAVTVTVPVDFRQAALEYGYQFFRRVCSEQLLSVIPVITSQGQAAYFWLTVEGEAEQLPWEAMHDG